jgi:TatD DNase family protein
MNNLFDIACNFSSERFDKDLDLVIERAQHNGVNKFLLVSASLSDFNKIHQIHMNYFDNSYFTIGVHPHHANEVNTDEIKKMKEMIVKYNPSCIGETGLDFFRNISTPEEQLYAFEEQIKLAIEFNKPLYLHQRDSHEEFIKIVKPYKNLLPKCVVHCFTGTQSELDDYLELGFFIGLTGWICDERRNVELRKSIKNIPTDRLMIETDCPYLIPRNLENKPKNNRNEPSYLPHIAKEVADLMNMEASELSDITFKNSMNFFN